MRLRAQLQAAIKAIEASGWGILLYLRQEGRGIGLINKLRATPCRIRGTTRSSPICGWASRSMRATSHRRRDAAAVGQDRIRLLTNNPAKVAGLEAAAVAVAERVPHKLPPNPHNAHYLEVKRDRTGHLL